MCLNEIPPLELPPLAVDINSNQNSNKRYRVIFNISEKVVIKSDNKKHLNSKESETYLIKKLNKLKLNEIY
jgi:hypothetical protein